MTDFQKASQKKSKERRGGQPARNSLLDDIENLTREQILNADDTHVDKLKELLFDARKKLNPYSVKVDDCYDGDLLFSFINMQRDFMIKMVMTAVNGFLRRAVNEWGVPDAPVSVPVIDVVDYLQDPELAEPAKPADGTKLDQATLDAYNLNKEMMKKRIHVAEFLEYFFGYDSDRHARPGYKPNYADPERRPILTPSAELSVLAEKKRVAKSKSASKADKEGAAALYDAFKAEQKKASEGVVVEKPCVRTVQLTITGRDGKTQVVDRKIKCTETEFKIAALKAASAKSPSDALIPTEERVIAKGSPNWLDYFDKRNAARDQTFHDHVRDLIPPSDVFYKFNQYLDKHYEQVLEATRDLYHEKPDFDASIFPYIPVKKMTNPKGEVISIDEQVKRFRHAKERDISFGISQGKFGNWTIIAPYKQNRDRVEYFGKHMAIFDEMFKLKASERVLAKDMVDKATSRRRKAVQKVHGKNDPNFEKNYGSIGGQNLDTFGVEKNRVDADSDHEDDIEVGVFRFSQGGKKLDVTKFYTESEAPEFMQEKH